MLKPVRVVRSRMLLFVSMAVLTMATVTSAGKIAFQTNRDGDDEIYIMKEDGSSTSNLTNAPGTPGSEIEDRHPSICPSGTQIVFQRHVGRDDPLASEIYVMDSDGTDQTNVTNSSDFERDPDCGPQSGTHKHVVVFYKTVSGNTDIYSIDTDGGNLQRLTTNTGIDLEAAWCKDQIVFISSRDGDYEVFIMDADGSNQTQLTSNTVADRVPACNTGGSEVAFTRYGSNLEVYKRVIATGVETNLSQESSTETDSSWSPGSTAIAFSTQRDGNFEIYSMPQDDGDPATRLTTHDAVDVAPDWGEIVQP